MGNIRHFLSASEQRLLRFASAGEKGHKDALEKSFQVLNEPKVPLTLADFKKKTDIISRQGTRDIEMTSPKWMERLGRWTLGKAGYVFGIDVYDADQKALSKQVDLNTHQRMNAAQEQLGLQKTKALHDINERAHRSVSSHAFLRQKAEVCDDFIKNLSEKKAELEKHGELASAMRKIEKIDIKITQLEKIRDDVKKKTETDESIDVQQTIQETDTYFRELFAIYKPESVHTLSTLLQGYALGRNQNNEYATHVKKFHAELEAIAHKMFPESRDEAKRQRQLVLMIRTADALAGKAKWRCRTKNALGLMGLGVQTIRNKIRYGQVDRNNWFQEQIAMHFMTAPAKALEKTSDMLDIKKIGERLKKFAELSPGSQVQIQFQSVPLDLTILTKRGDMLYATDAKGNRYGFDLKGFEGKNFITYEETDSSGAKKLTHKALKAPDDIVFSA